MPVLISPDTIPDLNKVTQSMLKIFLSIFLLLSYRASFAEWNPEYLGKTGTQQLLNQPAFQQLKKRVLDHLKTSWCSQEKATLLMDFVFLQRPQNCAEIGVFTGSSLLPIAATLNLTRAGQVFGIDPWSKEEALRNVPDADATKAWWRGLNYYELFETAQKLIKTWNLQNVCFLRREPSRVACRSLPPLDFLHIDGNYSEQSSIEDVQLYLPKVKEGGYILYTNINWVSDQKMPRIEAFQLLLDACEIIAIIDDRSTFLLRKRNL